jgi:hypothetical protein
MKDGAFILCMNSSFYTVNPYRIIAYGAFLPSRLVVIRRFVVSTFCSCRRFDVRRFVFRRFVFRRFVFRRFVFRRFVFRRFVCAPCSIVFI